MAPDPLDVSTGLISPVNPHVIVLFGATGDLVSRKLVPGLFHLAQAGLVPECRIIGTSLDDLDDEGFRAFARESLDEFARHGIADEAFASFSENLSFVSQTAGADGLAKAVAVQEDDLGGEPRRLHYLSVPPRAAREVVRILGEAGLVDRARIIMEKPFGTDLASSLELNNSLHQTFAEHQIFRIDHFLGKEAALNIRAFRFANGLFEPIWNRSHIDHVQIDVPETLGLGHRAPFYETTGAYRDMVVTHLFQVMAFMAMEPPTSLEPRAISEEKNKVFRSMLPSSPSTSFGASTPATSTSRACRPTPRPRRSSPSAARSTTGGGPVSRSSCARASGWPRAPGSKLSLSFYGKRPGPGMKLDKLSLQFSLHETGRSADVLEAYERLIYDAMIGDHTLFTTAEGIERLWELSSPLLSAPPPTRPYATGSWGPNSIHQLVSPMPGGCRSSGPDATAERHRSGQTAGGEARYAPKAAKVVRCG